MLIRPTGPTLVEIFFWIFPMAARLERLISIKTKEYLSWSPLWKRSVDLKTAPDKQKPLRPLLEELHDIMEVWNEKSCVWIVSETKKWSAHLLTSVSMDNFTDTEAILNSIVLKGCNGILDGQMHAYCGYKVGFKF